MNWHTFLPLSEEYTPKDANVTILALMMARWDTASTHHRLLGNRNDLNPSQLVVTSTCKRVEYSILLWVRVVRDQFMSAPRPTITLVPPRTLTVLTPEEEKERTYAEIISSTSHGHEEYCNDRSAL
ncbi:uncharacterized protein LACBIDRAFT_323184 [Laccaria bicolor S238N-H82]|uniref:Predicted protein n=1 Tax=Laccaria bicolor (strain S238N-H82 / ATCC MYA-4686) TaxID=486041 RepID=B0CZE4_LACBS|nr:uncharacterized protein LACBIDRAFT_323184 [Laccaria bicolor S238N-H82]EDR12605.1 predicted protein [Laccaria bicolor S238N-H82]|eukprot:XP_001876869.1 predicted protein [Laccaria bicolor S238N-H82]